MRALVLGAGATGGYYGARLLQSGRDVTFLVRPSRADKLSNSGLILRSPAGNAVIPLPPVITKVNEPYDLIILSCKAYDLDQAISAIEPAVGAKTLILPILNGLNHLDTLADHFGEEHVLGGTCYISSTIDSDGSIVEFGKAQTLIFGELSGGTTQRCERVVEFMAPAKFTTKFSDNIMLEMWQKFVANTTIAGITCLMRNSVNNIIEAPSGKELITRLFLECISVATSCGFPPSREFRESHLKIILTPSFEIKASMFRDIERGNRTEGDHVLGDMIAQAKEHGIDVPMVRLAYCNVKAYEIERNNLLKAPIPIPPVEKFIEPAPVR